MIGGSFFLILMEKGCTSPKLIRRKLSWFLDGIDFLKKTLVSLYIWFKRAQK
jgi:hypothetical protein